MGGIDDAIRISLQNRIRHFDTASYYGNESDVGNALISSGVNRDDLYITTKLWYEDMKPGKVRKAFETSLNYLQVDYIDCYLIHWPIGDFCSAWKEIERLYEERLSRTIGVSNFQIHHLENLAKTSNIKPMINQFEVCPFFQQRVLIEYCMENEIAVEAWGPFGKGSQLSDIRLKKISAKYNLSVSQLIIQWHLQEGRIVIPKAAASDHIIENAEVMNMDLTIGADDIQLINKMDTGISGRYYMPEYDWK